MKRFLLIGCLALMSSFTFGQIVVGDVDINRADSVKIVEVYVNRRAFRNLVHVYVDYGQKDNFNAQSLGNLNDGLVIMDPLTNRKKVFKSTVAVLNFFESNGWEYMNSLIENTPETSGYYYYFRRRQVN
jgi:hypothetical protein